MFSVEAVAMGRTILFVSAPDAQAALARARSMVDTYSPRVGREIVVRGPSSTIAWWTAGADGWLPLGEASRA